MLTQQSIEQAIKLDVGATQAGFAGLLLLANHIDDELAKGKLTQTQWLKEQTQDGTRPLTLFPVSSDPKKTLRAQAVGLSRLMNAFGELLTSHTQLADALDNGDKTAIATIPLSAMTQFNRRFHGNATAPTSTQATTGTNTKSNSSAVSPKEKLMQAVRAAKASGLPISELVTMFSGVINKVYKNGATNQWHYNYLNY